MKEENDIIREELKNLTLALNKFQEDEVKTQ